MRKLKAVVVIVALAALLGGCSFITGLFGPGKNNIRDWVASLTVGTKLMVHWSYTDEDPAYSDAEDDIAIEVVDVIERETRTVIRVLIDGSTSYLIADDTSGKLVMSDDDLVSDDDGVVLKVPVEDGGTWVDNVILLSTGYIYSNVRATISTTKGTRDAGVDTATDVVDVTVDLADIYETFVSAHIYFSPKYGWLGERAEFSDGTYTWVYEMSVTDIDRP